MERERGEDVEDVDDVEEEIDEESEDSAPRAATAGSEVDVGKLDKAVIDRFVRSHYEVELLDLELKKRKAEQERLAPIVGEMLTSNDLRSLPMAADLPTKVALSFSDPERRAVSVQPQLKVYCNLREGMNQASGCAALRASGAGELVKEAYAPAAVLKWALETIDAEAAKARDDSGGEVSERSAEGLLPEAFVETFAITKTTSSKVVRQTTKSSTRSRAAKSIRKRG
jgi:hypothetical protein